MFMNASANFQGNVWLTLGKCAYRYIHMFVEGRTIATNWLIHADDHICRPSWGCTFHAGDPDVIS